MNSFGLRVLLVTGALPLGGCLSAQPPDTGIHVPMPGVGASATYQVKSPTLAWETTYYVEAQAPFLTGTESVHPGLWIRQRTKSAGGEIDETTRVFDLVTRLWGTAGASSRRTVGLQDPVYGTVQNLIEGGGVILSESLEIGSVYDPMPLSELSGTELRDGKVESVFSADFAGFGVALAERENASGTPGPTEAERQAGRGRLVQASYAIRVRGTQAIVEVSIGGVASNATLVFEEGVAFPVRMVVRNDLLPSSNMEFHLLIRTSGVEQVAAAEPGTGEWGAYQLQPLSRGIPPEGPGPPLALPLHVALAFVENDPAMAAFRVWRTLHPKSVLSDASLEPWRDSAGRAGLEWELHFAAPGNSRSLVRSILILEPPALAGYVENRDLTAARVFSFSDEIDFDALKSLQFVPLGHYAEIAQSVSGDSQPLRYATWHLRKETSCWLLEWDNLIRVDVTQYGFLAAGNEAEIKALALVNRTSHPGALGMPHAWLPC